jgi:hypothetical protein
LTTGGRSPAPRGKIQYHLRLVLATTFKRFSSAADLLRPRTFFRALARIPELADRTSELQATVARLQIRTEQLIALERLNREQQDDLLHLAERLDVARIETHVRAAVAAATLETDPFPHVVVDSWLPDDVYAAVVKGVPPAVFFADREVSRQRLMVPFSFAPIYADRVWRFMYSHIVGVSLSGALNDKFKDVVRSYVQQLSPSAPGELDLTLHSSDGHIMLRRPGYVISPHRDPKWGFVTGLVYLVREGDPEAYGTQLYRVTGDEEAPTGKPFYVDASRCELAKHVPFRANTMLAFLNSAGAHGASIPADAVPPSLERYVYQFRLGPDQKTIAALLSHMSGAAQVKWSGAKSDRALARDSR